MISLIPTVTVVDGQPRVSSLDIAEKFGKRHDDVLRTIKRILSQLDEDFRLRNFAETLQVNEQNGQKYPTYSLTRDGFSLLAMGFTGKAALAWKVKYIEAFNAMEAELLKKVKSSPRQKRPRKALPASEQLALAAPKKDKFEAYIEEVEAFRVKTHEGLSRLQEAGLKLMDWHRNYDVCGPVIAMLYAWLETVVISPCSLHGLAEADRTPLPIMRKLDRLRG